MLCQRLGFVFVHIPKTGGTSLESALLPHALKAGETHETLLIRKNHSPFSGPPHLQHLTASEYMKHRYVTDTEWARLSTFAMVRNPWAQMVSEYNAKGPSWKNRLLRIPWNFKNFLRFLPQWWEDNYLSCHDNHRHVVPQWKFVCSNNGFLLVDRIIPLEKLSSHLPWIRETLALEELEIPHENKSRWRSPEDGSRPWDPGLPKHYSRYYDAESRDLVARLYKRDINLFNYRFEE